MKRVFRILMRVRTRYYVSATVIMAAIAVTPSACRAAFEFRGYDAVGGEALIIPFGFLVAYIICTTMKDYDMAQERRKRHGRKNKAAGTAQIRQSYRA